MSFSLASICTLICKITKIEPTPNPEKAAISIKIQYEVFSGTKINPKMVIAIKVKSTINK